MHIICVEISRFLCLFICKEIFTKSIFPKTIRQWNNLSADIKGSDSEKSFENKQKIIYGPKEANKLFVYGHGRSTTNHCRMRLGLVMSEAIFSTTILLTHCFVKMKVVIMYM